MHQLILTCGWGVECLGHLFACRGIPLCRPFALRSETPAVQDSGGPHTCHVQGEYGGADFSDSDREYGGGGGGASLTGAQASALFGERGLWVFSACFTVAALFFSEIIPKIIGVAFNRPIARVLAGPIHWIGLLLLPATRLIGLVSRGLLPQSKLGRAPKEEVRHLADISAEEGSILPFEAYLVKNALDLDKVTAGNVMTPVSVVQVAADREKAGTIAPQSGSMGVFSHPTI